ncbi:hypothetical protein OAF35_03340 [Verrucomicrobiales bacterium]|nr:hypothetical protein [Verrucomicrobiales bacterium]
MPLRLTIGSCQGKGAFINCPHGLSRGGMREREQKMLVIRHVEQAVASSENS